MSNKKTKQKMTKLKGIPLVSGIAMGSVYAFGWAKIDFPKYWVHEGEIQDEVYRFMKALGAAKRFYSNIISKIGRIQGLEQINILDSHLLLLQDELLVRSITDTIRQNHVNAEWAVHKTISELKDAFLKIHQGYMAEIQYDIDDIEKALLAQLMKITFKDLNKVPSDSIVVAYNLSPAELVTLSRIRIAGFVTEIASSNSHMVIIAKSLGIPSVMGVPDALRKLSTHDKILLNGDQGYVICNPTDQVKKVHEQLRKDRKKEEDRVMAKARKKTITIDGKIVHIFANVELLEELSQVTRYGGEGIGLYRTEFIFLDRTSPPSFEEQKEFYEKVLERMHNHEVIFRTLDLGGDKIDPNGVVADEENPALGLRAIRYCLREKHVFSDQLKALLAASPKGNLKICIPMVTSVSEMLEVKSMLADIKKELISKKIPFRDDIPVGVMIETPAAAMEVDLLAQHADFFSVGTNDLIQYLLAVDRGNQAVQELYSPYHPCIFRVLKNVLEAAKKWKKEITLCGEIAADPSCLFLMLALGFERLSMTPWSIPSVKDMIRSQSLEEMKECLNEVLLKDTEREIQKVVSRYLQTIGESFQGLR